MSTQSQRFLFILGSIIFFNLLPLFGMYAGLIEKQGVIYIYWAEAIVIAAAALLMFYAKHLLVISALLGGAALFWYTADDSAGLNNMKVPMTFWVFYSLGWLIYFEVTGSQVGLKLRRMHPVEQFIFYLVYMALTITICFSLTATMFNSWEELPNITTHNYLIFLMMAIIIPTLAIGLLKIIHMVGSAHFFHFILGTYHRPVEKESVVLFIDMEGSCAIAEKLSPRESMRLIAKFIYDASAIIHKYGGDILNFTGDGLVCRWPIKKADKAVSAVYGMRTRFEKIRPQYQREFGIKPYFRMGLHAGPAVISQIGEAKLFLGLYGETVNTASRLEQLNKTLGTKVLLSRNVVDKLNSRWLPKLQSYGLQDIRGRSEKLEVFTIKLPGPPHDKNKEPENE